MAQLTVRKLDEALVRALKIRAAINGRSAEAEHRAILAEALADGQHSPSLKAYLLGMPDAGTDEDFERLPSAMRDTTL